MFNITRRLAALATAAAVLLAPAAVAPKAAPAARAESAHVRDYYDSEGDANSAQQGYLGIGDKAVVGYDSARQKWYVEHWTP